MYGDDFVALAQVDGAVRQHRTRLFVRVKGILNARVFAALGGRTNGQEPRFNLVALGLVVQEFFDVVLAQPIAHLLALKNLRQKIPTDPLLFAD